MKIKWNRICNFYKIKQQQKMKTSSSIINNVNNNKNYNKLYFFNSISTTSSCFSNINLNDSESTEVKAEKLSFIEKARTMGANALLGLYTHTGDRFDKCLTNLKILEIGDGKVKCVIPVESHLHNANKNLHGGAICTLVDVVGTLALLGNDPTRPGVSVDINVNFIRAGMHNEDVYIDGTVLKTGKKLGFTQVDLKRKDGTLIATGRHTKAFTSTNIFTNKT